MLLILLLSAFEFPSYAGRSAAMLAGAAVPDGQHSFSLNPALGLDDGRVQAGICYSRPYALPGLAWSRAAGCWSSGRLAAGIGFSNLGLDRYHEQDAQIVLGGTPAAGVAVGLGIHALIVSAGPGYGDVVPALDAGVCWQSGCFRAGAAGLRINSPRWHDGTEVPPRVVLAGSWQPVDEALLALDLGREGTDEYAAFGAEFQLVPQLALRLGAGVVPLRLAAGFGAAVGPLAFDYAYQFHPVLKDTPVFGLRAAWH